MKPNILIILTDQQNASMMSCTGNQNLKTPSMDYLSNNGVRFEKAYCSSPVCMPSRFSLFTGQMPSYIKLDRNLNKNNIHTINYERVDDLKKTGIGYILKDAGYDVAYAGKQHLPGFVADDIGFDVLTQDERETCTDICSSYIKKKRDKPFCLVASLINPHDICFMAIRDFATTPGELNTIKNGALEVSNIDSLLKELETHDGIIDMDKCPDLPPNYQPQTDEPGAIGHFLDRKQFQASARANYTNDDWRKHRYVYHRLTEMVDAKIGQLLEAVNDSGIAEDTLIIFTSDHGDMDSAHKLEHKTVFYEESTRIPLIVCQKNKTSPGRIDSTHLISNGLDLVPTLCDYAGAATPKDLIGYSFRPIVDGKEQYHKRNALPIESELGKMIVTKQYKYAKFNTGDNNEQLYDLNNDPYETKNFLLDPAYDKTLQLHRNLLNKYMSHVD